MVISWEKEKCTLISWFTTISTTTWFTTLLEYSAGNAFSYISPGHAAVIQACSGGNMWEGLRHQRSSQDWGLTLGWYERMQTWHKNVSEINNLLNSPKTKWENVIFHLTLSINVWFLLINKEILLSHSLSHSLLREMCLCLLITCPLVSLCFMLYALCFNCWQEAFQI